MTRYFDAIITCEDVVNGKPAPDIFLLACKKINVAPEKCFGYEDADVGMQSLKSAGIHAIDVRLMDEYPHKLWKKSIFYLFKNIYIILKYVVIYICICM